MMQQAACVVTGPVLLAAILLAMGFGLGLRHGQFCAVACVDALIQRRSARRLRALWLASLWVAIVVPPCLWLGLASPPAFPPLAAVSGAAVIGGLLFGLGAAINGGCAFGTVLRLADGDLSFVATLAGMAAGGALLMAAGSPAPQLLGASPLESAAGWSLPLFLLLLLLGLAGLAWPSGSRRRLHFRPEHAVSLAGVCGGLMMLLVGPWHYTMLFDPDLWTGRQLADLLLLLLLLFAVLAGASLAGPAPRLRLQPAAALGRLPAGIIMGLGAGLVPGGNDGLILAGIPSGSPHALAAAAAMLVGIAGALLLRPWLLRWRPQLARLS